MKIRVLRILTRLAAGGPPSHSVLLTRELPKLGYETHLAVGHCSADEREMTYLLEADDPVVRIPSLRARISPLNDLMALFQLIVLMRRIRPHIVHTHTAKAGALGRLAARLAGVPVVVHTFHGHVLQGYFSQRLNRMIRIAERSLAKLTDRICVLSSSQAAELSAELQLPDAGKIAVVPLGFDVSRFERLPDAPDEPFTVCWLGRFVPVKDIDLLRRVVEQTLRQRADIRFLIAGSGPEGVRLIPTAKKYPANVELMDWREDVRPVLSRSHILLLTSKQEGTPVSIVQGMAARRPFVSTKAGGLPELSGGGTRGTCFAPDARELAGGILHLASHPEERMAMGRAGSAYASEAFAQTRLIQDLDRLYHALLDERRVSLLDPAPQAGRTA